LVLFAASGCSYIHFGPASLSEENDNLRTERDLLRQQLSLAQQEGATLRSMIESPVPVGTNSNDLVARLNQTSQELTSLRLRYETLRTERDRLLAGAPAGGRVNELDSQLGDTEDRLATALRAFTQLQDENEQLRSEVNRVQQENSGLRGQVQNLTTQNQQIQSALYQLNTQLLAQTEARAQAEQAADTLRLQLQVANETIATLSGQRSTAAGEARSLSAAGLQAALDTSGPVPMAQLETSASRMQGGAAAAGTRTHVIVAGDTLSAIALRYYGSANRWPEIYEANRAVLLNERSLVIGRVLTIP